MSGFHDALSTIAEREAIRQLKGKEFEIDQSGFVGHVKAVDPEKYLDIDVDEFELGADTLTVSLAVACRYEIDGTLKQDGVDIEITSTLDAAISVDGKAKISTKDGAFFVDPDVDDLDASIDILSLEPEDLTGGKDLISALVNAAFVSKKVDILKNINKSLKKQKLDI